MADHRPREVLEGRILAVSRQTKTDTSMAEIPGAPERYSFAKITEPIEVPGLLDLQLPGSSARPSGANAPRPKSERATA